jgi:hypothetical protein
MARLAKATGRMAGVKIACVPGADHAPPDCGGTAIRWKMGANDVGEIIGELKFWLDMGRPHPRAG